MQSLVQIAQALADETRLRLLYLLLDGDATVNDLVTRLDIPQPRVSTHLALLRQAGLVSVVIKGRQRVYRVDTAHVRAALEALQALASPIPPRSSQATREVRRDSTVRQARTCYDHLAGVAGVELLEGLLQRGWLEPEPNTEHERQLYRLTTTGTQALSARGVDIIRAQKARRRFAFGCVDWTERQTHLGGALGAAMLDALVTAGVVRRQRQTRAMRLQKPVTNWLD